MSDITLKAMPFDSNEILDPETGETTYDRVAYSRDLAAWLRTYFSNGVLVQGGDVLGNQLQVLHDEGLNCTVKSGAVCINGRTGWLEADTGITFDAGGAQPRIDRVVAELNIPNDRGIYIKILSGTPAADPAAPELTQTEDVYQIPLAQISIEALSATIAGIVDERQNYISNVTIGIKPPTGMDAITVQLEPETAGKYGVENVDDALKKAVNLTSYMAFCANVNADSLDSAFGKNNDSFIYLLGLQLAMYSWFKGDSKITYPFSNLKLCDSLADITASLTSRLEFKENLNLWKLVAASTYAQSVLCNFITTSASASSDNTTVNKSVDITQTDIDTGKVFLYGTNTRSQGSLNNTFKLNGVTIGSTTGLGSTTQFIVNLATHNITVPGTYTLAITFAYANSYPCSFSGGVYKLK